MGNPTEPNACSLKTHRVWSKEHQNMLELWANQSNESWNNVCWCLHHPPKYFQLWVSCSSHWCFSRVMGVVRRSASSPHKENILVLVKMPIETDYSVSSYYSSIFPFHRNLVQKCLYMQLGWDWSALNSQHGGFEIQKNKNCETSEKLHSSAAETSFKLQQVGLHLTESLRFRPHQKLGPFKPARRNVRESHRKRF